MDWSSSFIYNVIGVPVAAGVLSVHRDAHQPDLRQCRDDAEFRLRDHKRAAASSSALNIVPRGRACRLVRVQGYTA